MLNPDEEIPTCYKLKEHLLRDVLRKKFQGVSLIFDQRTDKECPRRPDVMIERLTHTVIIKCGKSQHKNPISESKRNEEIFRDLGNRPLVVIRFNPDRFSSILPAELNLNDEEWKDHINTLVESIEQEEYL